MRIYNFNIKVNIDKLQDELVAAGFTSAELSYTDSVPPIVQVLLDDAEEKDPTAVVMAHEYVPPINYDFRKMYRDSRDAWKAAFDKIDVQKAEYQTARDAYVVAKEAFNVAGATNAQKIQALFDIGKANADMEAANFKIAKANEDAELALKEVVKVLAQSKGLESLPLY